MSITPKQQETIRRLLNHASLDENDGATARLKGFIVGGMITVTVVSLIAIAYAGVQWPIFPGFVWFYIGLALVTSIAIASLLWLESWGENSGSLAVLAATFAYTTCINIAFVLSFPGTILPDGPWIGGPQSSVWLYIFGHAGTLIGIGVSSMLRHHRVSYHSWYLLAGIVVGCLPSMWVIVFSGSLPVLLDNGSPNILYTIISVFLVSIGLIVGLITWSAARETQSRLRWWLILIVAMSSSDVFVHMFATGRWEVAWYIPRFLGALTGVVLMIVLYTEAAFRAYSMTYLQIRERLIDAVRLQNAAETDPLTGCLNRRGLTSNLQTMSRRGTSARTGWIAVLFIDVDNFKDINDLYSHEVGDKTLIAVASAIKDSIRDSDYVSRYGGDEFVVVGEGLASYSHAQSFVANVHETVGKTHVPELPDNVTLTVSIGWAMSQDPRSLSDLMKRADIAMHDAKDAGRNAIRFSASTEVS